MLTRMTDDGRGLDDCPEGVPRGSLATGRHLQGTSQLAWNVRLQSNSIERHVDDEQYAANVI